MSIPILYKYTSLTANCVYIPLHVVYIAANAKSEVTMAIGEIPEILEDLPGDPGDSDEAADGFDSLTYPQPPPPPQPARRDQPQQPRPPRQQPVKVAELNVYDDLGDVFPQGKTVQVDPPLVKTNLKIVVFSIDRKQRDKRKARTQIDDAMPPLNREDIETVYGPGLYLLQVKRTDNGQMITQTTYEVEAPEVENPDDIEFIDENEQPQASPQEMAKMIAVAVAEAIKANSGGDKYQQLMEKIAMKQLTGESGGTSNIDKTVQAEIAKLRVETEAMLQRETIKANAEERKQALRMKEASQRRQWNIEDENRKAQQDMMLAQLQAQVGDADEEGDEAVENASGSSVMMLAQAIDEMFGVAGKQIFGIKLSDFLLPSANMLASGLTQRGIHITNKKELEELYEEGRKNGFREGQADALATKKKVRDRITETAGVPPLPPMETGDAINDGTGDGEQISG
jgi:hypothetical protein